MLRLFARIPGRFFSSSSMSANEKMNWQKVAWESNEKRTESNEKMMQLQQKYHQEAKVSVNITHHAVGLLT
jgi:hypothetical protein